MVGYRPTGSDQRSPSKHDITNLNQTNTINSASSTINMEGPKSIAVSPAKVDPMATQMFSMTGKLSLMNRVQNSPGMAATGFKGKAANTFKSNGAGSTIMGSTMDATGLASDYGRSSPFRDTVTKGMITGVGLLNKTSFNQIKKTPVN